MDKLVEAALEKVKSVIKDLDDDLSSEQVGRAIYATDAFEICAKND